MKKNIATIMMLLVFSFTLHAHAKDYPIRPITIIVSTAPGGFLDLSGRQLATLLSQELNQTILISNSPGGAGNTAINRLLNSPSDGYTFALVQSAALAYNPLIMKLRYTIEDLAIISSTGEQKLGFFILPSSPWENLHDAFAEAKRTGKPLRIAVPGTEALGIIKSLAEQENIPISPIPQQGGTAVLTMVLGGHADMGIAATTFIDSVKANKVRLLASASSSRIHAFPDIPTLKELGYGVSISALHVLLSKKDVPMEIQKRIEDAMVKISTDPKYQDFIYDRFYFEPSPKKGNEVKDLLLEKIEENKNMYTIQ